MNKNLKLRGILFSIEVLTGMDTTASLEERKRLLMKQEEEQRATAAAAAAAATAAPAPTYDTSKEIKGLSSVKSKYMDKIRAKTGGSDGSTSLAGGGGGVPGGDANILFKAKKMMASAEANSSSGSNKAITSASRWLLSAGMGSLLDYASFRTMQLSLFPLPASPKQLTQQLLQQISDTQFIHVARDMDAYSSASGSKGSQVATETELRAKAKEEFEEMEKKLGPSFVSRQQIVISSDDMLLEIGKQRGYYTCRFRPENALFGKVVCDFTAKDALEIQDALEELNGVAYRNSAFGSRTFR